MHFYVDVIDNDFFKEKENLNCKIKSNLKNVFHSVNFCAICLETGQEMFHMENYLSFNEDYYPTTTQQMFYEVFAKTEACSFPSKYICEPCCSKLVQGFIFVTKARHTSKILNSYLDQINSQLDNVENTVRNTEKKCELENAIIILERDLKNTDLVITKKDINDFTDDDSDGKSVNDFTCSNPCQNFDTVKGLRSHSRKKHYVKTKIKCIECISYQCAHTRYLLNIDQQRRDDFRKSLKCLDCAHVCTTKKAMMAHVNNEHLKLSTHLCDSCGQYFHSNAALYKHMRKSHEEEYVCECCDVEFDNNQSLIEHLVTCRSIQRDFSCLEYPCPASFDTIQALDVHKKKHDKVSCDICSKKVRNEHFLKRHKHYAHEVSHTKEKKSVQEKVDRPRLCSVCPDVFYSLSDLKHHLKSHDPSDKHRCQVCDKKFATRKEYNIHISTLTHARRVDPNTEFNFKCTSCNFTCKNKMVMENHQNTVHLKVKPYECHICSKTFTTRLNLKYHQDRHVGVKRYQCSQCSNMFTSSQGLKKHVLRHHSDKRPIGCESCDKTFVCQSELNLHKLRNHSEKSIPCPLCKVIFSTMANLRAHTFKVHFKSKEQFDEFMRSKMVSNDFYEMFRDHRLPF